MEKDDEIKALKAKIAEYQKLLQIDYVYKWDKQHEKFVKIKVPEDERDQYPTAIDSRDATIKMMEEALDELFPIVEAAGEVMRAELSKYKTKDRSNLTYLPFIKLYDAMDKQGYIDFLDLK